MSRRIPVSLAIPAIDDDTPKLQISGGTGVTPGVREIHLHFSDPLGFASRHEHALGWFDAAALIEAIKEVAGL